MNARIILGECLLVSAQVTMCTQTCVWDITFGWYSIYSIVKIFHVLNFHVSILECNTVYGHLCRLM